MLWLGYLPLKIKCFGWLCIHQKILTWDSLQKCGFLGPRRCCFCLLDLKNMDHVFGSCSFFQDVWDFICNHFFASVRWDKSCLTDNIHCILKESSLSMDVLLAILWTVWRARNLVIFQNGKADPYLAGMKAIGWLHSYGSIVS